MDLAHGHLHPTQTAAAVAVGCGYFDCNRLATMQRGTLATDKSGISGTAVREEDWTLDPTGNWGTYLTKTSGTTDLNQTRAHNKANETGTITSTPAWTRPVHGLAGNMTTIPRMSSPGTAQTTVYDAWNRLVELRQGGTVIADYKYDGRGRRIFKSTTDGTQKGVILPYQNAAGGHPTLCGPEAPGAIRAPRSPGAATAGIKPGRRSSPFLPPIPRHSSANLPSNRPLRPLRASAVKNPERFRLTFLPLACLDSRRLRVRT